MSWLNDEQSAKSADTDCEGSFYRLSQTADGTQTTLLPIDRPVPDGEQVIFTFKVADFDKAMMMVKRFLGFI